MNFENMSKKELIEYINSLNEEHSGKYGLVWDAEKVPEQVVVDCNKLIPVLKEEESKNIDNGGEDNILIEGENFHSLSVLNYTHKESIDVIYIDPPYNTGNKDFIYNDSFVDEEDGYRHSKWLNFMSKRLKLARNLLKEDGIIFISIDDKEQAQLKLLCDKVFGNMNWIATLPTIMNLKGNQDQFGFAGTHEYTVVYAKDKKNCELGQFNIDEEEIEREWLKDDIGYYKKGANLKSTGVNAPKEKRPNLYFPIYVLDETPCGKREINKEYVLDWSLEPKKKYVSIYPTTNGKEMSWRWSKEKFKNEYYNVIITSDGKDGISFYKKQRPNLGDVPTKKPKSFFYKPEYSSGNGTNQVVDIFGNKIFNNPKPVELLKDFIRISSYRKDLIILDFFAGSGTTGQAVLELNKEDGGSRKFILCTNNENNICEDVTYQRIKTVITGKRKDNSEYSDGLPGSLKYFKTDFVENNSTRDQIYFDLTEKCIPMLCVKESTFDLVEKTNSYIIYKDKNNLKYTCIYFDILNNHYDEFIEKIKQIEDKKALYILSLNNRVEEYELDGITNYKVEAIPQKIYDLYRKLVKLSKEK